MKKTLALIALCASLFFTLGFSGCKTTEIAKLNKAEKKVDKAQEAVQKQKDAIQDKAKSFVWGAGYANLLETNRTPAIDISGRLITDTLAITGNPQLGDMNSMRNIVDKLMFQARVDVALAQSRAASSEKEAEKYKKEAEKYKREVDDGNQKLKTLENKVVSMQEEEKRKEKAVHKAEDAKDKLSEEQAVKAAKYDEDHTFLKSINPFHDFAQGFKKLAGWFAFLTGLTLLFSVLEMVFPELKIVGVIFGKFGKMAMKLFPSARKAAGVVGENVWSGFKNVVVAFQHTMDKLKNHPIEDKVLDTIPDDAVLNKTQVKKLLEKHTANIVEEFKNELNEHSDAEDKALVQCAKVETNIKPVASNVQI